MIFEKTEKSLDNLLKELENFPFSKLQDQQENFLEIINRSKYMITLHDVENYRPICLNDNFRDFYGFTHNWLKGLDYIYYIKTIHSSALHTLIKSAIFFKNDNPGYLNLKYKLLNRDKLYKNVVGTSKTAFKNGQEPKYAITIARLADEEATEKENLITDLTERELEIVELIVEGKSKKEIAHHLHLSEHTVKTHSRNIYKKLGIRKVSELVFLYNMYNTMK